jgi:predicted Ser/Thr protein kinase
MISLLAIVIGAIVFAGILVVALVIVVRVVLRVVQPEGHTPDVAESPSASPRAASTPRCPTCGYALPTDSPQGLCPRCLLQVAIEPAPAVEHVTPPTAAYHPGAMTPNPQDIAAHFPQLEVLELLGKGGMGAVYKARQPHLDRFVALKVLPPEVANDPAFAERFAREARALARLNHPNIVSVYDFGQSEGLYWLTMEFVDGVNLREAMRAGQLTPEKALGIVPQLCDALQFAHDEGVVHRDIKPENILLDRRGRVKVADFGLAKLLGPSAADTGLTSTQQVMGTLHYMAPEQLAGARAVDHRADIYSLGVMFYEMLTGELPLGHFPLPSKTSGIDARLDQVVLRTLEREPADRYQHASDIKTDLESIAHAPVLTPSATHDGAIVLQRGLTFWMTPQPGYARWVGVPMLALLAVYMLLACGLLGFLQWSGDNDGPLWGAGEVRHGQVQQDGGAADVVRFPPRVDIGLYSLLCAGPVVLAVAFGVLNLVWAFHGRKGMGRVSTTSIWKENSPRSRSRMRLAAAALLVLVLGIAAWLLWCQPWATPLEQRLVGKWKGSGTISTAWSFDIKPDPKQGIPGGKASGRTTCACTVWAEFKPDGTYSWTEEHKSEGLNVRFNIPADGAAPPRWESLGAHGTMLNVRMHNGEVVLVFQGKGTFSMELPDPAKAEGTITFQRVHGH